MFRCQRCGSGYSATHAATFSSCPRCQVKDRTSAPLSFAPFQDRAAIRAAIGSRAPLKAEIEARPNG